MAEVLRAPRLPCGPIESSASEVAPSLLVTCSGVGDLESAAGASAPATASWCAWSAEPMVTWWPPGRPDVDRFCLLLLDWRRCQAVAAARALWLVCDIPGQPAADECVPCLGLAGNFEAVAAGSVVLPFESPLAACGSDGESEERHLELLLYSQREGGLGARLAAASSAAPAREGFDPATFARDHSFGAPVAAARWRLRPFATAAATATAAAARDSAPAAARTGAAAGAGAAASAEAKRRSGRAAYSSGGPLPEFSSGEPRTLTAALRRTARSYPERGLEIYDASGARRRLRYSELLERAACVAHGLERSGLDVGSSALLQVPSLDQHFVTFWGCLLRRVHPVAVAIPPNYEDEAHAVCRKIRNVWRLLHAPTVITTAAHAPKVELLRTSSEMAALALLHVETLEERSPSVPESLPDPEPEAVAFYQLSSGSTGVPKCIQIAHRGVVAHIRGESRYCGISSEDVHVSFLPVDHVVPILTVHCCDVYHGCEEIQADVAWVVSDPLRWLQLVSEHRGTRTWSPNFAFKLVADALRRHEDASSLSFDLSCCRYWMNAGEQVTIPVCEEFLAATRPFGVVRRSMQPAFGMAEACTCMTYNNAFDTAPASRLDRSVFVNLGAPVPGIEIRIANSSDEVVDEEVVGRFQIRGDVITPGYLYNDEANREAFVGDGWFNTGDIGFIKDGALYLTGREKEMIIIRGANFYCYEVEDVVNALNSVEPTFTAAVSAHDPSTGTEGLAIFFVPRSSSATATAPGATGASDQAVVEDGPGGADSLAASAAKEIRLELTRRIGLTPSFVVPLAASEFPKTTSGKIQRSDLAKALRGGRFDARLA